jgi:hypothetical protein
MHAAPKKGINFRIVAVAVAIVVNDPSIEHSVADRLGSSRCRQKNY